MVLLPNVASHRSKYDLETYGGRGEDIITLLREIGVSSTLLLPSPLLPKVLEVFRNAEKCYLKNRVWKKADIRIHGSLG